MARMTMIEAIRSRLDVAMERDDNVVVCGEDIGYFGGVFRVTHGLQKKYGRNRCFDTPISELGIFGAAVGRPLTGCAFASPADRGDRRAWDKRCIPAVCFTDPEIVSVGMSAEQARAAGFETKVAHFPFAANGRAMTLADESGFIRVVGHATTHEVLGVQATGRGISEFAASFALAIEMGARLEDVGATIHARPTLGEGFQEACLRAPGHAIHI